MELLGPKRVERRYPLSNMPSIMHVTACPTMLWSTGGRAAAVVGGGWMVGGGGGGGATGGRGCGLGWVSSLRGRPRLRFTGRSGVFDMFCSFILQTLEKY